VTALAAIIPEPDVDNHPVVYGYVRAEEPDEIQIGLLRNEIGQLGHGQGYHLAVIFVEPGVADDETARTGFTGLLDVLELDATHGAVVPDLDLISSDNYTRAYLYRLIQRTAAKLIAVYREPDDFKVGSA